MNTAKAHARVHVVKPGSCNCLYIFEKLLEAKNVYIAIANYNEIPICGWPPIARVYVFASHIAIAIS